jgi:ribonucleoside-diphosphate reductase alpha chain
MKKEMIKLSNVAVKVLKDRYLLKDNNRKIIETPVQMFKRVARYIAQPDKKYNKNIRTIEKEFFNVMSSLDFLPNSPTLMNAETLLGQLSGCFVIPIEDSIESIFSAIKYAAIIHQSGGGCGYSFSKLRPRGDIIKTSNGLASGPVSFIEIFDKATDIIKQGGKRRGANMGVLNVNHPDILEFISCKKYKSFNNFNLSVAINDNFIKAVENDKLFPLINPRTKKVVREVRAKKIFNTIIENAWERGDPGIIFIDEINRKKTLRLGKIEAVNPCGEMPLYPYESCNLGSINLSNMVNKKKINWDKLKDTVHIAVHFLDNVISINKYPLEQIRIITKNNRKIGLGVMGFAEMLIKLEIPYASKKAIKIAEDIMKFIGSEARNKSEQLGKERGSFPNFKKSIFYKGYRYMRNATVTTIAPTGTLSIIANTSSGIEPLFALSFVREILGHKKFFEVNKLFIKTLKKQNIYSKKLIEKISKAGSIQKIKEIPLFIRELYKTSMDIKPEYHLRIQAAFQRHTDNAVSKTINLPNNITKNDIRKIFMLAYKLKCKGITIYRYGSKKGQVLNICSSC